MASINKYTEMRHSDSLDPSLQLPSVNNYFHQPWNYISYISHHQPPVEPISSSTSDPSSSVVTREPSFSSSPASLASSPSVVTPSMFPNIYSSLPTTEKVGLQESLKSQPTVFTPSVFPNNNTSVPNSIRNGTTVPEICYQQDTKEDARKPTTPEKDMNDSGNSSGLSSTSSPSSESTSSTSSPPSLPNTNVSPDENKSRKNTRTNYSPKQIKYLEQVFLQTPYPEAEVMEQISRDFDIPEKNLRIWFQNKRARWRKRVQTNRCAHNPTTTPRYGTMPPSLSGYGVMPPSSTASSMSFHQITSPGYGIMPPSSNISNRTLFNPQPPLGQVPPIPYPSYPTPYMLSQYR